MSIGGGGSEHAHVIGSREDGSPVVAGWLKGDLTFGAGEAKETTLRPLGSCDAFVASFDAGGGLGWARQAGGSEQVSARGLHVRADGSAVVLGVFSGRARFGPGEENETELTSLGSADLFVGLFGP